MQIFVRLFDCCTNQIYITTVQIKKNCMLLIVCTRTSALIPVKSDKTVPMMFFTSHIMENVKDCPKFHRSHSMMRLFVFIIHLV